MGKRTAKSPAVQELAVSKSDSLPIRLLEEGGFWNKMLALWAHKNECKAKQPVPTGMQQIKSGLSLATIFEFVRHFFFHF